MLFKIHRLTPYSLPTADYTYSRRGQLDLLSVNSVQVANYGYDLNGNLTGRTLNNSTSSTYGYDALNRYTSISHALVGATRTFAYGYDAVGNRDWVKREGNVGDAYDYDQNDQAIAVKLNITFPDLPNIAGAPTIAYDANGNRTSFSPYSTTDTYAPANNLNQYTTRNGTSATYDANGNMTTGFDGSTYTYDAQSRLLTARKHTTTDTFTYDGLNRQISKRLVLNLFTTESTTAGFNRRIQDWRHHCHLRLRLRLGWNHQEPRHQQLLLPGRQRQYQSRCRQQRRAERILPLRSAGEAELLQCHRRFAGGYNDRRAPSLHRPAMVQ